MSEEHKDNFKISTDFFAASEGIKYPTPDLTADQNKNWILEITTNNPRIQSEGIHLITPIFAHFKKYMNFVYSEHQLAENNLKVSKADPVELEQFIRDKYSSIYRAFKLYVTSYLENGKDLPPATTQNLFAIENQVNNAAKYNFDFYKVDYETMSRLLNDSD